MKKMMFALLGVLFFPVVSIALESEATSNKAPLNVADIWSFEKDSYKEYGPRREDAFDNIFDIDVYINNAPDDDAPWLARHLDGRPLEKITDEDGRKGFRIPAGFSQPSRTLDNMWFVDVEIMGASPEASMESAIKSWPELDSTVINFQQRIYFGQFDSFSLTMHMTFEGESVIEETTVHEVEGAATTVGVDLNMRSYEDTKNIIAARNPPASEDLFGEDEDVVDFPDGVSVQPPQLVAIQSGSLRSLEALLFFALLVVFNMDSSALTDGAKDYVYDYSYSRSF